MIWLVLFLAPKVLMTAPVMSYADVTVQVDETHLALVAIKVGHFKKPTAMQRYLGRFTVRALGANGILESVQLDLPLLAEAETDDASDEARVFAEKLRARASVKATVRVPLPEGTLRLEIVDEKVKRKLKVELEKGWDSPAQLQFPSPSPAARSAAPAGAPPAR